MKAMKFGQQPYRRLKAMVLSMDSQVRALRTSAPVLKLEGLVVRPIFGRVYAIFALFVLLVSTLWWSLLGARLNSQNADQLVNAQLFENHDVLSGAWMPGNHSFLLKWPAFWLIKFMGYTAHAYVLITVATVLITIALLALILYRIERRPLVIGTIFLALASVLMLVPATPYAGALLPVNMAMLTTRNIEYIVFIVSLGLMTRAQRLRSPFFWCGVLLLGLLIASDKLFLSLSIGGAVLALLAYSLSTGWNMVSTTARLLVGGITSAALSLVLLWAITARHITHFSAATGTGPYGLIRTLHDGGLGIMYGLLHILSNFGVNPAANTTVLSTMPGEAIRTLLGFSGPSFVINGFILIVCLLAAARMLRLSLAHNRDKEAWLSPQGKLAIALLWSAIAGLTVFVVTDHYYAADARYLAIWLFSLFIAVTVYASRHTERPFRLAVGGALCVLSILFAIPFVVHNYHQGQQALAPFSVRNDRIAAALQQHPVNVLVGDYWRVVPVKAATHNSQRVMPLASCTVPRGDLSSKVWQPDLTKTSFAYIYSLDASLTDFPHCSLDQIIAAYGRPNASFVTYGNVAHPVEMVLFYDRGAHKSAPITLLSQPSTVVPVELEELPNISSCKQPTIMNIVAHEDDDLLFINPDTLHDIRAGNCVRTVYITSGDAGNSIFYWIGREQGSQAAYSSMLNFSDIWVQRVVHLSGDNYATIANPRGNNAISLVYLHLPDGNLQGQGFSSRHSESLAALDSGSKGEIHDVYNNSTYTSSQLTKTITDLMHTYQPTEIRTQANYAGGRYPDHSDHMAAGRFAQKAYQAYETEHFSNRVVIPIHYYLGYPVHNFGPNVSGNDLTDKENAFLIYGRFDGGVCHSLTQCRNDPAYGAYLPRQYQNPF